MSKCLQSLKAEPIRKITAAIKIFYFSFAFCKYELISRIYIKLGGGCGNKAGRLLPDRRE